MLAGVANAMVSDNTVTNNGGGGIFVNDNGPVTPARRTPGRTLPCRHQ